MAESAEPDIDWAKRYPRLSAAPIVEAVIHWRARAERPWNPEEIRAELARRLPEYSNVEPQHEILLALEASLGGPAASSTSSQKVGWHGFRLTTADGLHIAQFLRDGLTFSRLRPYENWEKFEAEARRLWRLFAELAAPSQIQRMGVRFINVVPVQSIDSLGDYLRDPPTRPLNLPLQNFLYQSTFDTPGHELGINVVKTRQTAEGSGNASPELIVDIDVFTRRPMACDDEHIDNRLAKMRSLKNAVFFNLLTEAAIAHLQKG